MGLLDQLGGRLGGDVLQRILGGGGHAVAEPGSPDQQQFGQLLQQVPRDQLASLLGQVARLMEPGPSRDAVTPGVGGTNPLAALSGPAMTTVAAALLRHLAGGGTNPGGGMPDVIGSALASPGGVSGDGAGGLDALLAKIPGLTTTNPDQMDAHQVAALADYTRRNEPDAFGRALADVGQEAPSAIAPLLGDPGLSSLAGGLSRLLEARRKP